MRRVGNVILRTPVELGLRTVTRAREARPAKPCAGQGLAKLDGAPLVILHPTETVPALRIIFGLKNDTNAFLCERFRLLIDVRDDNGNRWRVWQENRPFPTGILSYLKQQSSALKHGDPSRSVASLGERTKVKVVPIPCRGGHHIGRGDPNRARERRGRADDACR
jgi:hypothetical protein